MIGRLARPARRRGGKKSDRPAGDDRFDMARPKRDSHDDRSFALRRRPGGFGRAFRHGRIVAGMACCCCCCLDVLGGWAGSYLGGLLGSGLAYRSLRRRRPGMPTFWWAALWSFLSTLVTVGIPTALLWALSDVMEDSAGWLIVGTLTLWGFVVTPVWCFVVARRFSGWLLAVSLAASALGGLLGFVVGSAIMGESFLLS